jgi:hypothetical protein
VQYQAHTCVVNHEGPSLLNRDTFGVDFQKTLFAFNCCAFINYPLSPISKYENCYRGMSLEDDSILVYSAM